MFGVARDFSVIGCPTTTTFNVCAPRPQTLRDANPFHEWVFPDGTLWAEFYRTGKHYLLRFPGLADFTISANGMEVVAYPVSVVSDETVHHLYLNQILPLAISRQWKLVLHAGAVEVENAAVAFIGVSGRGKSTLVASFATSGYRFLADDGLQVDKGSDGYLIKPSYPSIRLWDDARQALIPKTTRAAPPVDYTPKARLLADNEVSFCDLTRPLRCMYFLGEWNTDAVRIEPVNGRDAMVELVKHSFLLDTEEREMRAHHFGQLSSLAEGSMFFRLDYPRRFDILPEVRDAVIRHATGLPLEAAFREIAVQQGSPLPKSTLFRTSPIVTPLEPKRGRNDIV